ncbi:S26 family signal peptidase [Streptomyces sp. T1317-0309]|nr:S26 family signal peptidase [Streptomyces sp. T1317-0309]
MVTSVTARTVLGSLIGLLVWAQLPVVALGWTACVVQSGSMRPALVPGDVVLYQPPPRDRTPAVGHIVLVQDPTRPGHLLTHRATGYSPTTTWSPKATPTPHRTPPRSDPRHSKA